MVHQFDFLVLGSGIAGLSFALKVAPYGSVAIVTKKQSADSNTNWAQGGIAAVMDPLDSFEKHIEDTLIAGAGLCKREAVEVVVKEGPGYVRELMEMGARFTQKNGSLDLGREGGHSMNRIVRAEDMTGREIERALLAQIRNHPNIQVFEHHFALELITQHHLGEVVTKFRTDTQCYGAYVLDEQEDKVEVFLAKSTLLATGGGGQVYAHTTNPLVATGDGMAMAYRAKARIANMEFVQFHPTSLYRPGTSFLITEAVRGEGGLLFNQAGERFMPQYDARLELAPRDIVARAINDQMNKRGEEFVYLNISHKPKEEIIYHFPNIYEQLLAYGIDMTKDPIPVTPAAHYFCGGVMTDLEGRTSINGLFACGEVTCTGLHGANRLASNSLVEAMVFGNRAVQPAIEYARNVAFRTDIPAWDDSGTTNAEELVLITQNRKELQAVMSAYVGIVRTRLRLERAYRRTHFLFEETEGFYRRTRVSVGLCELRNLITVAYMIIKCGLQRNENRGLHYMLEYREKPKMEPRDSII
ncbi:MAG: L-aspartate oxidase [Rhodothermia bacterium]|nr:L-aspartate oxidase [Rhodothermia bacterium]